VLAFLIDADITIHECVDPPLDPLQISLDAWLVKRDGLSEFCDKPRLLSSGHGKFTRDGGTAKVRRDFDLPIAF